MSFVQIDYRQGTRRRPVWRSRTFWRAARRVGMATFLIGCFFLGGSVDHHFGAPGFRLDSAVTGLALGVLLIFLIWALVEASGYIYRTIRGIP